MQPLNRKALNVYVNVPRALESDWIGLLRQIGFLSEECREKGISLNVYRRCQSGFHREEPCEDGLCVCISMMDEVDYSENEKTAAAELLKRDGVACVLVLLRSEANSVAYYEVDGSALHIVHYTTPSEIRIPELSVIRGVLNKLGSNPTEDDAEADVGGRAKEIHPGFVAVCGLDLYDLLQMNPDVIVTLDSLPGDVWEEGFGGDILYYPIQPWGVLPFFILERLVVEIDGLLEDRKRVALYSGEDCGRVGYVAACVLFQRGIREPIDFVRGNWEASALSVKGQEDDVRLFCYRHVARTYWHCVHLTRHIQIDSIDAFKADQILQQEISRVHDELGDKSRIVFRFSGLLPSVRIMVEAATVEKCQRAIDDIIKVAKLKGHYLGTIDGW